MLFLFSCVYLFVLDVFCDSFSPALAVEDAPLPPDITMAAVKMFFSVVVMAALAFVVLKYFPRYAGKISGSAGRIKLLESVSIGKGTIYMISVDNREFLIGVNENGIRLITELTPSAGNGPGLFEKALQDYEDKG